MLLTFPIVVIRVNTIEKVVEWRWRNMAFIGIGSFLLSFVWRWLLGRKERGRRLAEAGSAETRPIGRRLLDRAPDLPAGPCRRCPLRHRLSLSLLQLPDEHHDDRPDLRDARSGSEHRRRPGGSSRSRLRRLLCRRGLQLRPAEPPLRPRLLGGPPGGRPPRRPLRHPPGLPGPPPPGGLPGHRHARLRRDHPPHPRELERLFLRAERHLEHPPAGVLRHHPVALTRRPSTSISS